MLTSEINHLNPKTESVDPKTSLQNKLLLSLAAFCYALLVLSNKWLTDQGISAFNQIFWRAFGGIVFSGAAVVFYEQSCFKASTKELKYFIANGLFFLGGFCTFNLAIFLGTPMAKAVSLNYAYPLIIVVFNFLIFKELPNLKHVFSIALSMASVALILEIWKINNWQEFKLGEILALANAFFYGGIIVFGKLVRKASPNGLFKSLFYAHFVMLVLFCLLAFSLNQAGFHELKPNLSINFSVWQLLVLFFSSLIGGVLPLVLIYIALPNTKPYIASLLLLTEPIWVFVLGWLFFGQSLTVSSLAGMFGILTSVFLI
jgi:drug/metabolite transporter, DME family